MDARRFWAVVLMAAVAAVPAARGVWLDLPSTGAKCVSEELHNNVVVLADYYAFIGEDYDANNTVNPSVTVKVTSPYGNDLYHKEKVQHGQFAFTTTEMGNYMACFSLDGDHHGKKVTVGIEWKTGIAAKDWDSVAKKEKIEGLELVLKKLEEHVESIHLNLNNLIKREAEMRMVSETTNAQVAWYSIMSLGLCIFVSVIQVFYLRQYFQKKKLI
ncbi:Transmembrane emp24 domain-containing protein p24delta3 [Striga hermonthica]|uniref:Transmembrane emp24 domain-containing protein p24delta3 n=1 Tax=Striga hermonthica TaxID=68872 RepID=A0A9N7RF68_STRHE|nr:Transmembrane emp24 domain-containing protein p24delta3 [Striga hermonthica]